MPHRAGRRAACGSLASLLLFGLFLPALAQQILYEYDALGRLIVVTSPEGVAQYEYDAVGNILRITTRRYADRSGPVPILGMSPTSGPPNPFLEAILLPLTLTAPLPSLEKVQRDSVLEFLQAIPWERTRASERLGISAITPSRRVRGDHPEASHANA